MKDIFLLGIMKVEYPTILIVVTFHSKFNVAYFLQGFPPLKILLPLFCTCTLKQRSLVPKQGRTLVGILHETCPIVILQYVVLFPYMCCLILYYDMQKSVKFII